MQQTNVSRGKDMTCECRSPAAASSACCGGYYKYYVLFVLTASFIVGEINHFLLGVVSMDAARDVGYGDKACYGPNGTADHFSSGFEGQEA